MEIEIAYNHCLETRLSGRYISLKHILPLIEELPSIFKSEIVGKSEKGNPILTIRFGHGKKKIFAWSQMHGNESTTTKGVFDFLNLIVKKNDFEKEIESFLSQNTVLLVPMLNPDGADSYTRHNANDVDLNRDAKNQSQKEIQVLMKLFHEFKPDLCLNLHDQRTIYGVGTSFVPATISFLSPAANTKRSLTPSRIEAMAEIARMNQFLQPYCPGGIGRYDDGYNENCVGDHFQGCGIPTILFEAGHFSGDYERTVSRKLVFFALCALFNIVNTESSNDEVKDYLAIPENNKLLRDIILRNVKLEGRIQDVAIQFQEGLKEGAIQFEPLIDEIGSLEVLSGHREIDIKGNELLINSHENVFVGEKIATICYKTSKKPINI